MAGGSADSIGWTFQDVNGVDLRSGSVDCAKRNRAPTAYAGPDQTVTLPDQATMCGRPSPTTGCRTRLVGDAELVAGERTGDGTFTDPTSPSTTTVSFTDSGTYVLRLTADDSTLQASDDVSVTVYAAGTVTLDTRVAASADDAEESATEVVSKTSSDLELVFDGTNQTVGLRFASVPIPPGATILDAYVQFESDEVTTGAASLTIQGQAADQPTTFSSSSSTSRRRPRSPGRACPRGDPGPGGWEPLLGRGGCWATKDVTTLPTKAAATHTRSNVDHRFLHCAQPNRCNPRSGSRPILESRVR